MQQNKEVPDKAFLHRETLKLMGNRFEISVVTEHESRAKLCVQAAVEEIGRIEKLLTTFNESSQTNLVNRNAGIRPVKVDKEVFDLINRSKPCNVMERGMRKFRGLITT
mgnify:CR=1 FL=1